MTYEPSKAAIEAAASQLAIHARDQGVWFGYVRAALIAARKVEDTLRVESPNLHAQFQAMAPDAPLPWEFHHCYSDTLVDANQAVVCHTSKSSGMDGLKILAMILTAVNTCGGFKAIWKEEDAQK